MRLTLRTMLAYLDDVLEPSDALELGKKIDESKFAGDLVHRIRTSMKQLRLDAPKVDGKGMGLDANSVAEYLDNTLPHERVSDFEKVCLDSDRHLAEVAACHQILTIVLGEPAHVEYALKDRIYRIGLMTAAEIESAAEVEVAPLGLGKSEEMTSAASSATSAHPPVPPPKSREVVAKHAAGTAENESEKVSRPVPEVPDYLRETSTSSRLWPLALTVLAAFVGCFAVMLFLGPLDHTHPVLSMFLSAPEVAQNPASGSGTQEQGTAAPNTPENSPLVPPDNAAPVNTNPNTNTKSNDDNPSVANPTSPTVTPPAGNPNTPPVVPNPAIPATDPAAPVKPDEPRPVTPVEPANDPTKPMPPAVTPPDIKPVPMPMAGGDVGRYSSEQQVLAHFDATRKTWRRIQRGTSIVADERYVVPLTYRPIIALNSGVQAMFVGDSSFRFRTSEMADVIGVSVEYGRLLLSNTGRAGSQVALNLGGEQGIAVFADREAEVAIEVRHYLFPGSDPERDPTLLVLHFFGVRGRVDWQPTTGPVISLPMGQGRFLVLGGEPPHNMRMDQPPVWLDENYLPKIDRDASLELEKSLLSDKALPLAMVEQTEHRKTEVRSLAARCLGSLDEFDGLIEELGSDKQHSYWGQAMDSLREAIARGPSSAAAMRTSLERKRSGDAAVLFRLIQDYSPEQLERGGAKQLVSFLEHNDLDVRVMAYETLRRITGFTQNFRPEVSIDRRKLPVQKWNEKLKEGLITYKTAPSPLPERKAAVE